MNSTTDTEYIISLDQFQGPLDLLHQLVEKRKLQINTISLAKVTADYIAHIQKMSAVPAEEIARFVHIASILIFIKSKSLLPLLEYTKEEEGDVVILEERMKLFDYIRTHAIPALSTWRRRSFPVCPPRQVRNVIFSPDASCTVEGLQRNARAVINDLSFLKTPPRRNVGRVISLGEVIENVLTTVSERIRTSFREFSSGRNKEEKILSFLAILELMRKDLLLARQDGQFDDILLVKEEQNT